MKYRIMKIEDRFYPEYRKWFRWHMFTNKFCYGCKHDALRRIQSNIDSKHHKHEIIKVVVSKGKALLDIK